MTFFFFKEYNMLIMLSSCLGYLIMVTQSHIIIIQRQNTQKHLNDALNQNANMTRRARYATFTLRIVDNSCSLQHYFINGTQSKYACRD